MDHPRSALPTGTPVPAGDQADGPLLEAMTRLGRGLGGGQSPPRLLAPDRESVLVRLGSVVVKAHHPRTDPADLAVRVALAGRDEFAGVLLPPLLAEPVRRAGRWLTAWPFGRTVTPDPTAAPWAEAGSLLARLHATPAGLLAAGPGDGRAVPVAGGPARVARAVAALAGLADDPDAVAVRQAWSALPPWARDEEPVPVPTRLSHGDWHFGQLVAAGDDGWRLSDVDDLGLGDPWWDLGRPAAFRAIGAVTAEEFEAFVGAYRAGGGELPGGDDLWVALDVAARAYAVQAAARSLLVVRRAGARLDAITTELLAACRRMPTAAPS